jgi:hypothetical protein
MSDLIERLRYLARDVEACESATMSEAASALEAAVRLAESADSVAGTDQCSMDEWREYDRDRLDFINKVEKTSE